MKRVLSSAVVCIIVTGAMATPAFLSVFKEKYKISTSSNLGKAKCTVCHTTGKHLNPYGMDLKKVMAGVKKPTADMLAKVEGFDSTKSGVKNIDKIKADKLPGK